MTSRQESTNNFGPAFGPKLPEGAAEAPDVECGIDRLPACPVCGGRLVDIRQKWICERCHTICETCCEGRRG